MATITCMHRDSYKKKQQQRRHDDEVEVGAREINLLIEVLVGIQCLGSASICSDKKMEEH